MDVTGVGRYRRSAQRESEQSADGDYDELRIDGRQNAKYLGCGERDGSTAFIRAQAPRHIPNCLSDDRDSDKFQAMNQAYTDRPTKARGNGCKAEQQQDRRQRESEPSRESPKPAGAQKTG